jgi:hypothetical protein
MGFHRQYHKQLKLDEYELFAEADIGVAPGTLRGIQIEVGNKAAPADVEITNDLGGLGVSLLSWNSGDFPLNPVLTVARGNSGNPVVQDGTISPTHVPPVVNGRIHIEVQGDQYLSETGDTFDVTITVEH